MKHCDLYVVRLLPLGRQLQEETPHAFRNLPTEFRLVWTRSPISFAICHTPCVATCHRDSVVFTPSRAFRYATRHAFPCTNRDPFFEPGSSFLQGSSETDPSRFGNSKPCLRCLQALDSAGVRRVVFTTGVSPQASPQESPRERAAKGGAHRGGAACSPCSPVGRGASVGGGAVGGGAVGESVGEFGFEVRRVHELLAEGERDGTGHSSRGVRGLGFAPCGVGAV